VLITFSGLDGAGKSTLIEWLAQALEHDQRRVAVCHMNTGIGVYAALRAVRDRLRPRRVARAGGAPPPTAKTHAPAPDADSARSPLRARLRRLRYALVWNKRLRCALYPLDLLIFLCYRRYVERSGRVLIMDRYFYDTLVDVADGRRWGLLRLYERVTPTPTLPIFLDVGPEECFARKREYSVEYLQRRWHAYNAVLPWVPTTVRLAARDLDAAKATLHELVAARLASGART
jgi:thymidylate kinase